MKTLLLFFALFPFVALAQKEAKETPTYRYAEIVGQNRILSKKINVTIDYGQERKRFSENEKLIINETTGKAEKFNSMIDALNFMSFLGWEFVQAYVITESDSSTLYWILKKELLDEELEEYLPLIQGDLEPNH